MVVAVQPPPGADVGGPDEGGVEPADGGDDVELDDGDVCGPHAWKSCRSSKVPEARVKDQLLTKTSALAVRSALARPSTVTHPVPES